MVTVDYLPGKTLAIAGTWFFTGRFPDA